MENTWDVYRGIPTLLSLLRQHAVVEPGTEVRLHSTLEEHPVRLQDWGRIVHVDADKMEALIAFSGVEYMVTGEELASVRVYHSTDKISVFVLSEHLPYPYVFRHRCPFGEVRRRVNDALKLFGRDIELKVINDADWEAIGLVPQEIWSQVELYRLPQNEVTYQFAQAHVK